MLSHAALCLVGETLCLAATYLPKTKEQVTRGREVGGKASYY